MNSKYILLVVVLLSLIAIGKVFFFQSENDEYHEDDDVVRDFEIYPGDVVEKIKNNEDIILLDVRTPEEYKEIHLENAVLLPVQELSALTLAEIGLGDSAKDKEILIYCRSGARSKIAYNIMQSLGYTNIKSIAGGMIHWEEDEYPFTEIGEYEQRDNVQVLKSVDGPILSLNRDSHDFGLIPQHGGIVEADFIIENIGTETLVIGELTTSCSCTSAKISSSEIAPNSKATLTVVFDPDFHEEPVDVFKRTVFIPSNDKNTPEAEVTIIVDIEEGK